MAKQTRGRRKSVSSGVHEADSQTKLKQKRSGPENDENVSGSRKTPKQTAACTDLQDKSICLEIVDDESVAIRLTSGQEELRPNRRLEDFTFHDNKGNPAMVEMLEIRNMFISGLILPQEENDGKGKEKVMRCHNFGRIESWAISGYDEGSPVIWFSTEFADYECVKPSRKYKELYSLFFEKARACVEVYKKLSRSCGGNPRLSLDELIAAVVQSMSSSEKFTNEASIKDFIISHGEFIYNELIGLDATSGDNDEIFAELPVLLALRDEKKKQETPEAHASGGSPNTSLKIGSDSSELANESISSTCFEKEEDMETGMGKLTGYGQKPATCAVQKVDSQAGAATKLKQKRNRSEDGEKMSGSLKMPKWAAACSDFKDKSICFSKKFSLVKTNKEVIVEDETAAIRLTSEQEELRPNRRLQDFTFHDYKGNPAMVEMLEIRNLFISGLILPLEENDGKEKEKAMRCHNFGRIESWAISGYDDGSPVIWVSTETADYECVKPSRKYKELYSLFFEKARACVEVYTKLSRTCGGNPRLSLDELISAVVQSISSSEKFTNEASVKDFIISHGEFIYNELIGLDATSGDNDEIFAELPVLVALRDEKKKRGSFLAPEACASEGTPNQNLKTSTELANTSTSSTCMVDNVKTGIEKQTRGRQNSATHGLQEVDFQTEAGSELKEETSRFENGEQMSGSCKMPNRAAACIDAQFQYDPHPSLAHYSKKFVKTKWNMVVEDESTAIGLTSTQEELKANRRLKDFTFHDCEGNPEMIEMLEVKDLFISGLILPLEDSGDKEKDKGIRCHSFGRVESWAISGYEEGLPIIWVSTECADYECIKPSSKYKELYSLLFEKARACVEVYKKLSRTYGGNPNLSFDRMVAAVVRSMSSSKNFTNVTSIKEFIISHGEFIYNELVGLDSTSNDNDEIFAELPVLVALRDEKKKQVRMTPEATYREVSNESAFPTCGVDEDEDKKLARAASLQEQEEKWLSMDREDCQFSVHTSNFYAQINEEEIAGDYPLPAYYTTSVEETDEFLIVCNDGSNNLSEKVLDNWTIYNSDARLISLELLPMRSCAGVDLTIFGSGLLTEDRSGFCLDVDSPSSDQTVVQNSGGIPIYLSAIKEWMIEYGSSISISIRTDMAWYRLGKPSKQYAKWYEPVQRIARIGLSIITLLMVQSRASRLSYVDVVRKVSELNKEDPAFISSNCAMVEQYLIIHGQIILQQFSRHPDISIRNCPFVTGLHHRILERPHSNSMINRRKVVKKRLNMNPREAVATTVSKKNAMPATTTRLINRIWGDYYSNYLPEDSKHLDSLDVEEDDDIEEEQEENEEEDCEVAELQKMKVDDKTEKSQSAAKLKGSRYSNKDIRWNGGLLGKICTGEALYKQAIVHGDVVAVGDFVLMETAEANQLPPMYFIEYMFEDSKGRKMVHGRLLLRGIQTVLAKAANEREVFLTNDCLEFELSHVKQNVIVEIRMVPWGCQHRKANAHMDKIDRERADERKRKGLAMEYYCKSLYCPERGAFTHLPTDTMGLGSGFCHSCSMKEIQLKKENFKLNLHSNSFVHKGTEYYVRDFVYVSPRQLFAEDSLSHGTFRNGRNVGLRPYVICQLLGIEVNKSPKQTCPESTMVKIRRFFRPEDISTEQAYSSDIREVYYSKQMLTVPVVALEGKCEIRTKHDVPSLHSPAIFQHIFFCEQLYDPDRGTIERLPAYVKLSYSKGKVIDDPHNREKKGNFEEKTDSNVACEGPQALFKNRLATLDIFAGCGGLSEGLEQAGVSITKWAIEYDKMAGEAFKLNHPEALMFINNCNVILRAIMSACGDADDCISTSEALELAEKLDEKEISNLPRPGEVEFITGGPPCQGFSGLNRFNQGTWSKVQCEMILTFLSFADYFRPKFFLLENVRNFVSFNKGQTFRLTLASLLEMGYQVRFGVLEAGAYGVSQSRKRAFIWAASPEETLPEWPEPMHVFASPELKVRLSGNSHYVAVPSTANGAPFRSITVRDTIKDLPAVENGASVSNMGYKCEPQSCFQKAIRGDALALTDHISKEMGEINLIRCKRIPKRPGADWRDLPREKVQLSTGQVASLVPFCLPNTAKRHNQWKGLFGRLDWEGNFPTSVTDPQPMGKVAMCFHPDQDRIITVRECARSQGFPDAYKFAGNIHQKHSQVGNAVPPPLAYVLGRRLKEALEIKS